jgi:hypothetical protein
VLLRAVFDDFLRSNLYDLDPTMASLTHQASFANVRK